MEPSFERHFDNVQFVRERSKSTIIHAIWAIAGAAIGGAAVSLFLGHFTSDWVEATGTWFGAVATVLALLWAVQTFRADQRHRETERTAREVARSAQAQAQLDAAQRAQLEAEAAVLAEASKVSISLAGGAGQGSDENLQMRSVFVELTNDTMSPVTVEHFELSAPLVAMEYPRFPIRIPAGESRRLPIDVELINVDPGELSGNPIPRFVAKATYRVNGTTWVRDSAAASIPRPVS